MLLVGITATTPCIAPGGPLFHRIRRSRLWIRTAPLSLFFFSPCYVVFVKGIPTTESAMRDDLVQPAIRSSTLGRGDHSTKSLKSDQTSGRGDAPRGQTVAASSESSTDQPSPQISTLSFLGLWFAMLVVTIMCLTWRNGGRLCGDATGQGITASRVRQRR